MVLADVILRGTLAAQPAANTVPAGTLYFITDFGVLQRSDGTNWASYSLAGSGLPLPNPGFFRTIQEIRETRFVPQPAASGSGGLVTLVPPNDASFSWVNQGGASVVAGSNVIYLNGPTAASTSLRIRELNLPAAPYTLTAGFIPAVISANFATCGLCLRDSASGKVIVFSYGFSTVLNTGLAKFTNPTTFSASYSGAINLTPTGPYLWMRIHDDTTNRISSISMDGINFRTIQTIARTDFLTPDQIGFYVDSNGSGGDANMTLVSWSF